MVTPDASAGEQRTSSEITVNDAPGHDVERDAGLRPAVEDEKAATELDTETPTRAADDEKAELESPDTPRPKDEEEAIESAGPAAAPAAAPNNGGKNQSQDPEAGRTKAETLLIMSALCLALFLAALDVTIITTAIPTISAHFNSSAGYVWIGSAYLLGNASFVPTWGKVSDIFGRKPILLTAIGVFWVGSLLCGVSTNMAFLIAGRAVQGVGSGGIIALPNICISDLFSMRNRGQYFGILGMVWAVASAIGPVLGGVFTSKASWRWCFYINLPLSGIGMIILIFVLKLHNPRTPVKQGLAAIDWTGSLLIIGGTLMLLFGLDFGGVKYPWASAPVICLIVFGFVAIVLFILNEWKFAKYPVIPPRIFQFRTSIIAYCLAFLHAFVFMSGSYWLPLYFQGVLGVSSLLSGAYILPFVISLSIVSAGAGIMIKKTGNYKIPISTGLFFMTIGFGLFIDFGPHVNWAKMIVFQIIAGIGVGPNFQAPLIALQTNVEPRDIGSATSSFSFLRQLGTSISVVVGGVVFNNVMQSQQGYLLRELGPKLANELSGANAAGNVQLVASLTGHQGDVARYAYWKSLRTMHIVYTCFAFLAFVISLFIKQTKLSKTHQDYKTGLKSLNTTTRTPAAVVAAEEKTGK